MPKISDEAFKMRRDSEIWEFFLVPNTKAFHGSFLKKEPVELQGATRLSLHGFVCLVVPMCRGYGLTWLQALLLCVNPLLLQQDFTASAAVQQTAFSLWRAGGSSPRGLLYFYFMY